MLNFKLWDIKPRLNSSQESSGTSKMEFNTESEELLSIVCSNAGKGREELDIDVFADQVSKVLNMRCWGGQGIVWIQNIYVNYIGLLVLMLA